MLICASLMLPLLATAAPAAAQPTPADTLVGQRATICSYGVPIEVQVARAEWTKTAAGATAPGNGMWAIAIVDVTNRGQAQESLYTFAKLRDNLNREFKWSQYPPDPIELPGAYGVKGAYESFAPGVTEQSAMSFLVAGDAKTLTLEQDSVDPAACPSAPAPAQGAPGPSQGAPGPSQSAPAPVQATPADTLVGQRATICSYGVKIDALVKRAEWTKTLLGTAAPGNGMWVVAIVDVNNIGKTQESLYTFAKIRDDRGREFKWSQYPPDPIDLASAYGVKGAYERFAPGITEESVMSFVVAGDAKTLTLQDDSVDPASCS